MRFADRNPRWMAAGALVVIVVLVYIALNLTHLPFTNHTKTYRADFANAANFSTSDVVTIDGVHVGFVKHLGLVADCPSPTAPPTTCVQVTFTVNNGIALGSATTASANVETPLGTESLALAPAGTAPLTGPIPLSNTAVPYTLVGDLSELTSQVESYNIPQLVKALRTSSLTLDGTPTQEVAAALTGLARFSSILADNKTQLASIVTEGSQLATVFSQRSGQLVNLVSAGNLILQVLQQRQTYIKELLTGTTSLSNQLQALFGSSNEAQFTTLLSNLTSVSRILSQDSSSIATAMPLLAAVSRYTANATGSGPFADVSIPTLLIPDNLIAECASKSAFPSTNPIVGCRP